MTTTVSFQRNELLKPLGYVAGVVERRQTLPILSYLLLKCDGQGVTLTGTDLEVEVTVTAEAKASAKGEWMLPARKLLDICRSLPNDSAMELRADGTKIQLKAGRSRFSLLTLPVSDFPTIQAVSWDQTINISQHDLRGLLEETTSAWRNRTSGIT
jgi:DNA polymerase-3 subunit beta